MKRESWLKTDDGALDDDEQKISEKPSISGIIP